VFADAGSARVSHRLGLRRLVTLTTVDPTRWVVSRMGNATKLALATSPYPGVPALLADARLRAVGDRMDAVGHLDEVRDEPAFAALVDEVRPHTAPAMQQLVTVAGEVLALAGEIRRELPGAPSATGQDVSEQLAGLIFPGFIAATPVSAWRRLPTYLRAIQRRLTAAATNPRHEALGLATITELEDEYASLCGRFPSGPLPEPVAEVGWLLEELRVGLFAQGLGTTVPVSAKRVRAAMQAVRPVN
ncbi:MAG: DUF3418 domain-containing protein, partial [Propionicimonas sp.]